MALPRLNGAVDRIEQALRASPERSTELLAELYALYRSAVPDCNRYRLYVERHFDFRIGPHDRVLDIGSGHNPFPLATHLADLAVDDDRLGRAGRPLDRAGGKPLVACDVERLPFAGGAFDFVYCSHVLEHTADPAWACRELMRVGRRGYIETPSPAKDLWLGSAGESHHRWTVEREGARLIFRPHPELDGAAAVVNPLLSMHCAPQTPREQAFAAWVWLEAPRLNTMLYWEGGFEFEVQDRPRTT